MPTTSTSGRLAERRAQGRGEIGSVGDLYLFDYNRSGETARQREDASGLEELVRRAMK